MIFKEKAISEYELDDLAIGRRESFIATIQESDIDAFSDLVGDNNPLHISRSSALKIGFEDRVAHGVLALGLVSQFVGVHMPGLHSIIIDLKAKFMRPIYPNSELLIEGIILDKSEAVGSLLIKVTITDILRNLKCTSVEVRCLMTKGV